MFYKWSLVVLSTCILGSCVPDQKTATQQESRAEILVPEDAFHFYVLGDWGRNGAYLQKDLADKMNEIAEQVEPEFIVSTGDNFYPNGVASTQDYLWISSFEQIYSGHFLQCPWYVVLGNHDYRGNIQAQIDYTQLSRRWTMPSNYFSKEWTTDDDALVRMIYIDTNPLNDEYYEEETYAAGVSAQDTTTQLAWLKSELAKPADWKIVVGHHPLYTGGKRADDYNYVRSHLEKLFTEYGVNLYLAGHEHDLQHVKVKDLPTHHIVSGAGSEVRPTGKLESTVFAESVQGFFLTSVTKDSIYGQFINYEGVSIHAFSIK